jgi:hypothetical protein
MPGAGSRADTGGARVRFRAIRGEIHPPEAQFRGTFVAGRSPDCDVRVTADFVSRQHVKVMFDGEGWWLKDLGSGSGTFVSGTRVAELPLTENVEVELGPGGPRFALDVLADPRVRAAVTGTHEPAFTSETQILEKYLGPDDDAPAGRTTLMFRRAFRRAQERTSRKYRILVAVALLGLLASGWVLFHQARRLDDVRPAPGASSPR